MHISPMRYHVIRHRGDRERASVKSVGICAQRMLAKSRGAVLSPPVSVAAVGCAAAFFVLLSPVSSAIQLATTSAVLRRRSWNVESPFFVKILKFCFVEMRAALKRGRDQAFPRDFDRPRSSIGAPHHGKTFIQMALTIAATIGLTINDITQIVCFARASSSCVLIN